MISFKKKKTGEDFSRGAQGLVEEHWDCMFYIHECHKFLYRFPRFKHGLRCGMEGGRGDYFLKKKRRYQ